MSDQEKVKDRIQHEMTAKVVTNLLDELRLKDYQIRVIKCEIIQARIKEKIQENNTYMANARYNSFAARNAMYANKQLNEIYNMIDTIMLE